MKKSRLTEEQITFALRQAEYSNVVAEVCHKMGVSEARSMAGRRNTVDWASPSYVG